MIIKDIGLEFECFLYDAQVFYNLTNYIPFNFTDMINGIKSKGFKYKSIYLDTDASVGCDTSYCNYDIKTKDGNVYSCSDYSDNFSDLEIKTRWAYDENNFYLNLRKYVDFLFQCFGQNNTCGNHIHISFVKPDIGFCAFSFKEIYTKFIEDYEKDWCSLYKYKKRLQNNYCKADWDAGNIYDICANYNGDRYYAINLKAYRCHSTIEFRIMPHADNSNEYMNQITWVINETKSLISNLNLSIDNDIDIFPKRRNKNLKNIKIMI